MTTILERILETKRADVAARKATIPLSELDARIAQDTPAIEALVAQKRFGEAFERQSVFADKRASERARLDWIRSTAAAHYGALAHAATTGISGMTAPSPSEKRMVGRYTIGPNRRRTEDALLIPATLLGRIGWSGHARTRSLRRHPGPATHLR